ncbi:hypothetical protein [Faecalimonas umbilicata]|jgi:hypothetical protein|uniref:hypothetical protein n=1 Tax=Faecalimonas umbilicata TaxID=1912855 RepID=UPI000E402460|nr:hypothetical protein [Faecalimonas umbilicata]RGC79142.1 hypothetical protein DW669_03765 [Lachnospiraceae bacterium AM25-17]RJU64390.1 hypothetical protein DW709_12505 [Coprococcus sp. AM27-12LB]
MKEQKKSSWGAAMVSFFKEYLFNFSGPGHLFEFPNETVIKKYSLILNPVHDKIRKNEKENQELISLRDFLLPLLINGQVGFKS